MLTGDIAGTVADFDLNHVHAMMKTLLSLMEDGKVASAHDLAEGAWGRPSRNALQDRPGDEPQARLNQEPTL